MADAEMLAHDGQPVVREVDCDGCGAHYEQSVGFVTLNGDAHAIYYAASHHHGGLHDVWMDVILGGWSADNDAPDPDDHTTFSCRVGAGSAAPQSYASLVDGPVATRGDNALLFGTFVEREAALVHPRLAEFWRVVDFIIELDDHVVHHLRTANADP